MLLANQPCELKAIRARHHEVDDGQVERSRREGRKGPVRV